MITSHLRLLVLGGVHDGRLIQIQTPFLIGRAVECNMRPASLAISSQHCVIEDHQGIPIIRDLGSTNGTFLNDDRLMSFCELQDGDELRVGPLRLRILDASIQPEAEPMVIATELPRDPNDTVMSQEMRAADDTVVNDGQMTDDKAARLLLAEDDATDQSVSSATSETVLQALQAIEEPVAPQPTASAAKDILRQMRRSRK